MPRLIALYLPQFHPIPENDRWWGKGFTEWTNVRRAKPSFKGHEQPKEPGEWGYYNLLESDIKEQQARLAWEVGIEGFCYYHYWFGLDKNGQGKQLLEKPLQQVLESGRPDYPFCLCWANHTWSNKTWEKSSALAKEQILMEQTYGGEKDYTAHFYALLDAFRDKRYMKTDGRLLFFLYDCYHFADVRNWMQCWRQLAQKEGLPGFYFVGMTPSTLTFSIGADGKEHRCIPNLKSSAALFRYILSLGFDAVNSMGQRRGEMLAIGKGRSITNRIMAIAGLSNAVNFDYTRTVRGFFAPEDKWENVFPTVMPQWDRTARNGKAEGVYINATPTAWQRHLTDALQLVKHKADEHQMIVIKSWNEWAEGNYLEPDVHYGRGWAKAVREALIQMENEIKISVIVPTYRPGEYLRECLQSLAHQTLNAASWELVLVLDNDPTRWKQTVDALVDEVKNDIQVRLLVVEDKGVSHARNCGIAAARGEYITFVDDDDYLSPAFLEKMLKKSSEDTIALCNIITVNDQKEVLPYYIEADYRRYSQSGTMPFYVPRKYFSSSCMKLIHRDIIGDRRFDPRFRNGEDSLFMFNISNRMKYVAFTEDDAVYYRRVHSGSASRSMTRRFRITNGMRMIWEYSNIYWRRPNQYKFHFYLTRVLGSLHVMIAK